MDDCDIESFKERIPSREDLRCAMREGGGRNKVIVIGDWDGKRISHLPGKHPECVHVAGFRDLDCRVSSGFVRAD